MKDGADVRLMPGEHRLWEGHPDRGVVLRPIDLFLVPFSLLWGGFAIFWNVSAWTMAADASFRLFGLPFLVIGLYFIIGRFIVDMLIRRGMTYVVTSQRIVIAGGANRSRLRSLDIARLAALEFDERADGSGTIGFAPAAGWLAGGNNFGIWQPTFDPVPQFIRMPNVCTVYELIRRQAAVAAAGTASVCPPETFNRL